MNVKNQNPLERVRETLTDVKHQISELESKAGHIDELLLRADIFDQVDHLKTRKRQLERQITALEKSEEEETDQIIEAVEEADQELRREVDQAHRKFSQ